jgi:hypothetical protein
VVAVGADGHPVVYVGEAAADPRGHVVDMKHVRKVALADIANVMLPGGDSSALGRGEQPTWIPATTAHRDSRRASRMVSSSCCFASAPAASIDGGRSRLPTSP